MMLERTCIWSQVSGYVSTSAIATGVIVDLRRLYRSLRWDTPTTTKIVRNRLILALIVQPRTIRSQWCMSKSTTFNMPFCCTSRVLSQSARPRCTTGPSITSRSTAVGGCFGATGVRASSSVWVWCMWSEGRKGFVGVRRCSAARTQISRYACMRAYICSFCDQSKMEKWSRTVLGIFFACAMLALILTRRLDGIATRG